MVFKRIIARICIALCLYGSACSVHAEKYNINNFVYDLNDWYIQYLTDNLLTEAQKEQIKINIFDAQNNVSQQSHQFLEQFSPKVPLAINMVSIIDAQRVIEYVQQYHNNLVFYNRRPLDYVLQSYDKAWYVGVSADKSGYEQGQMIADYINEHPEVDKNNDSIFNIVMLKGQAIHPSTDSRCRAMLKALRENDLEYRIIDEYNADFSYEIAKKHMDNVLKIRGTGPIELIISNCDAMALGAIKALNTLGYNLGYSKHKKIPVFGWTGLPEAIDAIKKKKMQGTIAIDMKTMAKLILDLAITPNPDLAQLKQRYHFKSSLNDKNLEVGYKAVRLKDLVGNNTPLFD